MEVKVLVGSPPAFFDDIVFLVIEKRKKVCIKSSIHGV